MNNEQFNAQIAKITQTIDAIAELQKKSEQETAELKKELYEAQKATQKQVDATSARVDATSAKVDRMAEMYGGAHSNHGDVAEEFFYNTLTANPKLNGIQFEYVDKNISRHRHGIQEEYDLVLVNGKELFAIEVKYKAHQKDLEKLVKQQRPHFNQLFPEYSQYTQYWGLASFHVNDDLKKEAMQQGIHILQRKGDIIETLPAPRMA